MQAWIEESLKNGELFFYIVPAVLLLLLLIVIFWPEKKKKTKEEIEETELDKLIKADKKLKAEIEPVVDAFPLWLAPEQARILPITENQLEYAKKQLAALRGMGFRVELDERAASLGAKIKDARHERIPYLLVVGQEEEKSGKFAVRSRREGELGTMDCEELAKKWRDEVDKKL